MSSIQVVLSLGEYGEVSFATHTAIVAHDDVAIFPSWSPDKESRAAVGLYQHLNASGADFSLSGTLTDLRAFLTSALSALTLVEEKLTSK